MANGHGGARPGAGRKSDAQIAQLRTLIATIVTDDDWINIIKGILDDARSGDLRSVSFLLALRYGVSIQTLVAAEEADLKPALAGTRPSPSVVAAGGLPSQGPKGIVVSAAVRKPKGVAPAGAPAQSIIHRART